ncbi:hypothetical protein CVV65_12315 [Kyrpidia spormannii]|uniref:Ada DNA repair metal-binding domain-containing protein n=1 Tax=Kyrpidia spormannii TaxID=2055160 RepID=A0A2K8N8F8_9BACL|nr:hypothetical protein CVV65_12315 [Kyrpidia spormannii]
MTFRREHVRIFSSLQDALRAGFRPCRRAGPVTNPPSRIRLRARLLPSRPGCRGAPREQPSPRARGAYFR